MPTAFTPHNWIGAHRLSNRRFVFQAALVMTVVLSFPMPAAAQQVVPSDREGLLKGLGMDLAAIADQHNYPGPKDVIALKAELGLTRDQLKKAEVLDKVVGSSVVAKGEEIVQTEEELAQLFEAGTVNEKALRSKLEQIGKLRADLRFIHLQAHLRMRQILTPDQAKLYTELRAREAKR